MPIFLIFRIIFILIDEGDSQMPVFYLKEEDMQALITLFEDLLAEKGQLLPQEQALYDRLLKKSNCQTSENSV